MKKKKQKRTDLFVRELTEKDAYSYSHIASGASLHQYTRFFEANTIDEARDKLMRYCNQYEKMYGLFTKANRLVAVFSVSRDDLEDELGTGATVCYFVGEQYYGNNYALRGLHYLANMLSDVCSYFRFEVESSNSYSIAIQNMLGSNEVETETISGYKKFVYNF